MQGRLTLRGKRGSILGVLIMRAILSTGAASAASSTPVAPAESDRLLAHLWAQWEARRSEILTADVHYLQSAADVENSALTPADVAAVVSAHTVAATPESLRILLLELRTEKLVRDPPGAPSRLVWEGDSTRYEQDSFRLIRSGELELIFDGDNEQVSVYPRGQSRRMFAKLGDFRWVPPATIDPAAFEVESVAGPTLVYRSRNGDTRKSVDRNTGLVMHSQSFHPETGELFRERWECGVAQFAGGIPFPTATIQVDYRSGVLRRYWVRVIEAAEFNGDLDDSVFHMECPDKTALIDYRGDVKSGRRLRGTTMNLASVLGDRTRRVGAPPHLPQGSADTTRWLLALNGLLMLACGVYLWRRDRPVPNPPDGVDR